eukprot:CAMPEP_0197843658 /NCGR_PEP_ID=MMETSP1438-20131217/573_1 /TAXON_ID=1461541 /ORGANISM="Pterosperma sp., Strain CCMP1384" /LENGTH=513 /DNA_ID=CAMNT_0043453957 /DNA_START=70 /DNA_END=1611 /DNA_ORIENTATION=+
MTANVSRNALYREHLYIGGKWVPPVRKATLPVINPHNESVIGAIAAATAEDVAAAVGAAKQTFDAGVWSKRSAAERAVVIRRMAKLVMERKDLLSTLEVLDCGKPIDEAEWDIDDVAGALDYYADLVESQEKEGDYNKAVDVGDEDFKGSILKQPLGVVGLITPWNYPMLMAVWKVAPALAAGCSAVLKPSELASLTCLQLADIAHDAGVPPGVFNVITGTGPDAGAALARHPHVDKVAFTGSLATGRSIMSTAAEAVRPVSLELGGKSPIVVFDDAELEKALEWVMFGAFWTNGQICSATSRLLVQESIAPKLIQRLKEECEKINVTNPLDRTSRLGPLVSAGQYEKVLSFVEGAKREGATLLTGGSRPPHLPQGYYLAPTVFTNVTPGMTIWREEVFGPVLSVTTFSTEEEAVTLANDSQYGLAAAVLTADKARLARMTSAIRCGIVWANCAQPCFCQLPWGGLRHSGFGRDLGEPGLDKYFNMKQVCEYTSDKQFGWYPSFTGPGIKTKL